MSTWSNAYEHENSVGTDSTVTNTKYGKPRLLTRGIRVNHIPLRVCRFAGLRLVLDNYETLQRFEYHFILERTNAHCTVSFRKIETP